MAHPKAQQTFLWKRGLCPFCCAVTMVPQAQLCLLLSWQRLCWLTSWFTQAEALSGFWGASRALYCPPACPRLHLYIAALSSPPERSGLWWAQPAEGKLRLCFALSWTWVWGQQLREHPNGWVNDLERISCFCFAASSCWSALPFGSYTQLPWTLCSSGQAAITQHRLLFK